LSPIVAQQAADLSNRYHRKNSPATKGAPEMTETIDCQGTAEEAKTEMIREVCQQNKTEPGAIWEALEAKGVETTPGIIYQAFNAPEPPPAEHTPPKAPAEGSPGLSAEDLASLGTLATKAGGVEQLIRILSVWHDTPK
jgi:hypothetical protein